MLRGRRTALSGCGCGGASRQGARGVPPFMIFHDRVLEALAAATIRSLDDLRVIRGIGSIALGKYGADLLEILADAAGDDTVTIPPD